MANQQRPRVLTINTGSSSLKAALYESGAADTLILSVRAERIGLADGRLRIADAQGATRLDRQAELADHDAALQAFFAWWRAQSDQRLDAAGHRVVHGGPQYHEPQRVTPDLVRALQELIPLAPNHLPQAIKAIQAVSRAYPELPQVACFDTAFHRRMPPVAQMYALPRALWAEGVRRYGFHGLSYEYILGELRAEAGAAAHGRVVIAHLGNGASMAAVRGGVGVETTMGFTPTGGLVMGTRSGDLDPGVLLYLLTERGMAPAVLGELVNQQAGLLGVSGTSADMQDLLEREATDARAAQAIELFCYQARKYLGALAAVLGGLETLVFTGGIGENAASVRQRICQEGAFLGIRLDPLRNAAHAPVISRADSPVSVRVIKTDEDLMIARHTRRLTRDEGANHATV